MSDRLPLFTGFSGDLDLLKSPGLAVGEGCEPRGA